MSELVSFCCFFAAIFCLRWCWVMWWHALQKCMLIVWARSMGLTYFLWFSSWTATAAHVKQPNVFHHFWLGKIACFDACSPSQHFLEVYSKWILFNTTMQFTGFPLKINYWLYCGIMDAPHGLEGLIPFFLSSLCFSSASALLSNWFLENGKRELS